MFGTSSTAVSWSGRTARLASWCYLWASAPACLGTRRTFADQEFDDLLTQAEGTLDVNERKKIMAKIETIMQERGPICQPVWRSILTGMDKKVKGFKMHPQYHFRGHEMAIES